MLTQDQSLAVQQLAFEHGLLPLQMMELGASSMAKLVKTRYPKSKHILILAGPGVNGGYGLACARFLLQAGYALSILYTHPVEMVDEDTRHYANIAEKIGIPMHGVHEEEGVIAFKDADLFIDAMLGADHRGNARQPFAALISQVNASPKPVVSFDIPSGLCAETSDASGPCVFADETLTLGLPLTSVMNAREQAGTIFSTDIGIPSSLYEQLGISIPKTFFHDQLIELH